MLVMCQMASQLLFKMPVTHDLGKSEDLLFSLNGFNLALCILRYVALSDNEKTGFKARELKSVHVDAVGHFIKFVIHKNHVNRHNLYNQVCVPLIVDLFW
jgi:centrosomal protein CEP104